MKIKGYTTKSTEEEPRFLVSRRDCVKSEWIGIEERFPLHSNIIIECVEMQGKNWIGKIPGVPNISVYCFYPNRLSPTTGGPIIIKIGGQYSCFVAAIDAEKCIFRARVNGGSELNEALNNSFDERTLFCCNLMCVRHF